LYISDGTTSSIAALSAVNHSLSSHSSQQAAAAAAFSADINHSSSSAAILLSDGRSSRPMTVQLAELRRPASHAQSLAAPYNDT